MNLNSLMKVFAFLASLMLFMACVTAAPPSYPSEYDGASIRELVELLMQRERESGLDDTRAAYHTVSRKAGRSPQLRLRFGKRLDTQYAVPSAYMAALNDIPTEK
ncbi:hypothetical protein ABEB36_005529 [Hypothenemus hampei]|uniref:Uncharacterized protein n=1 Tax=Hypothenemus hampei TaxID=57062 RepID=A0ABD1EZ51_HYPHA